MAHKLCQSGMNNADTMSNLMCTLFLCCVPKFGCAIYNSHYIWFFAFVVDRWIEKRQTEEGGSMNIYAFRM